jgi:nitroimidazol reductase NimA-like FMN-containing flavoprotein (pyridoxamine 5'-phosphate oxidase superfamily)
MASIPGEAADLLDGARVMAHLATSVDDRPHVAPVWYAYESADESDRPAVYLTTTGRKLRNLRANPRVALSFQRDVDGDAQWMVAARGTATVLEDDEQFGRWNPRICEKYGADPDAWDDNTLVRVALASATCRTY